MSWRCAVFAMALGAFQARAQAQAQKADAGALAEKQLEDVVAQYQGAKRLFGDSHVLLTAVLYRASDVAKESGSRFRTGAAGLVGLPLWGFGGGHWIDWWPRLQTDDEAAMLMEFDRRIASYHDLAAVAPSSQPAGAAPAPAAPAPGAPEAPVGAAPAGDQDPLADRFERRARLFDELLSIEDRRSEERAAAAKKAAEKREKAEARRKKAAAERDGVTLEEEDEERRKREREEREADVGCGSDWVFEDPGRLKECLGVLRKSTAPAATKLEQLDGLWREYRRLKISRPLKRHNLLIGPTIGLPLNDGAIAMWGLLAEAGGRSFRVALSGGLVRPRDNPFSVAKDLDWWIGVGLSGQLGDDLFNSVRGAYAAWGRP